MSKKERTLRKVIIAVPSYDGKIPVEFASTLLAVQKNLTEYDVTPMFIKGDSLLIRARNDLFRMAYTIKADDLVFIDADMLWNASDLRTLLEAPVEFVGASYRKKTPQILFTLNVPQQKVKVSRETQLCEVNSLGTGFLRISKRAINKLWNSAPKYKDTSSGLETASVFQTITDPTRGVIGEDTYFCDMWRGLGEKVYMHTGIILGHMGNKVFQGSVIDYLREYNMYEEVD